MEEVPAPKIPKDWYRAMIQTANEGIWLIDATARTLYVNDRMATLLGTSPAIMTGQTVYQFTFPQDRNAHLERIRHNVSGVSEHFEARFRRTDGSEVLVLVSTSPLPGSDGQIVGALGMFTDITERKRMEAALRQSEHRFRRLVESNLVGIVVSDLTGAIYEANDVYLAMVGYSQEELLAGKVRWDALTPPEYHATDMQALERLRTTGVAGPYEKAHIRKDDSLVPVLVSQVLFDEERGFILGIVLDISERKALEQRKDEFISLASHELRTPLTGSKGNLELAAHRVRRLLQQPWPPEAATALHSIEALLQRALHLLAMQDRLIGELLDVSRIQAQTLELALTHCDLVSLVREVVENQRLVTPHRAIQLDLPGEPISILADPDRIRQVVSNYLTNALKYSSEEQRVQVGLQVEGQHTRVWVRDHGPGLSSQAQQHLWERFYRVPEVKVQSGSEGGLGLGLYLCRTLIALHQGSVGVQSTPGQGSTFWFTIPLAVPEQGQERQVTEDKTAPPSSPWAEDALDQE